MAKFHIDNLLASAPAQQNLTANYKWMTAVSCSSTLALRRIYVYQLGFGANGTPNSTDCAIEFDLSKFTAAGTGVASTPTGLDTDAGTSNSVTIGSINYTADGTTTANSAIFQKSINQRATWQWTAYSDAARLVGPATNLAGLALRARSPTYASTVDADLYFEE